MWKTKTFVNNQPVVETPVSMLEQKKAVLRMETRNATATMRRQIKNPVKKVNAEFLKQIGFSPEVAANPYAWLQSLTEKEQSSLLAFQELRLMGHAADFWFEKRCQCMEELGYKKMDSMELARLVIKGLSDNKWKDLDRWNKQSQVNFNFYNGTSSVSSENVSQIEVGNQKYRLGPVGELAVPIPYGVLLTMQDLQKQGLVNNFQAIAPLEAWRTPQFVPNIDPVVFTVISHPTISTKVTRFFLANW